MSKNIYHPFTSPSLEEDSPQKDLPPPPPASILSEQKSSLFQTLLQAPGYVKLNGEIELSEYKQGKNSSPKESTNFGKYKKICEGQPQPQPIQANLPFMLLLRLVWKDLSNLPKGLTIGILTIFMVVGFLTVLVAGNELTPLIFIKLAENQIGDADFAMTATEQNRAKLKFIDSRMVEGKCEGMEELFGCSGRWIFYGESYRKESAGEKVKSTIMGVDSQKEISIGLGRNLRLHSLKSGECYLTKSTSETLRNHNKEEMKMVSVKVDILGSLSKQDNIPEMYKNISWIKENITSLLPNLPPNDFSEKIVDSLIESLNLTAEFRVRQEIDEPKGKFSSVLGNVVIFDMKDMPRIFLENFSENLSRKQLTFGNHFNKNTIYIFKKMA